MSDASAAKQSRRRKSRTEVFVDGSHDSVRRCLSAPGAVEIAAEYIGRHPSTVRRYRLPFIGETDTGIASPPYQTYALMRAAWDAGASFWDVMAPIRWVAQAPPFYMELIPKGGNFRTEDVILTAGRFASVNGDALQRLLAAISPKSRSGVEIDPLETRGVLEILPRVREALNDIEAICRDRIQEAA